MPSFISSLRSFVTWCFHMVIDRIPSPFRGRDGCNSGGGKGITKKYFIDHLRSGHFGSEASRVYL